MTDLQKMRLDLSGLTDTEIEARGLEEFSRNYLKNGRAGMLNLCKGGIALFHPDRYCHAFRKSADRIGHPESKSAVAVERVERILWIKEVLEGRVTGTQCWRVVSRTPGKGPGRLFVVCRECYVVWLDPRSGSSDKWNFSSAYPATRNDIKRYTSGATMLWEIP